jgi:prepilin-type N-terminal cleavage/methylation domain-containing protein
MIGRPIRRPIRRKTSRGFSLLEVLVAFTILTMLLGALFQVFSNGLRAARAGDSYTRATVIAQSRRRTASMSRSSGKRGAARAACR